MKTFITSLACLSLLGVVGSSVAAPPHGKANILHCGCAAWPDGTAGMAYVPIEVSTKAKGHTKHGVIDTCHDGVLEEYVDVTRKPDCVVPDSTFGLEGLDPCNTALDQIEFRSCEQEEQVIAQ